MTYTDIHVVFCNGKPLLVLQTTGDAGVGRLVTRLKTHADTTYGVNSPKVHADCSPSVTAQTEALPRIGMTNEKAALEQATAIFDTQMTA